MRRLLSSLLSSGLLLVVVGTHLSGEDGLRGAGAAPRAGEPEEVPDLGVSVKPTVRRLAPGVFGLGEATFSKSNRFVRFPAKINMDRGFVEYLVVTEGGKVHESLLSTSANPSHIHLAMLLIGGAGAQGAPFSDEASQPLPGDPVRVEVTWSSGQDVVRRRAEEFIQNSLTGEPLATGPWVYNGSRTADGTFLAERDGSILSLVTDPDALVNNPRPGHDRDDIWQIRTKGLPPLSSSVEVIFWLDEKPPPGNAVLPGTLK